MICSAWQGSQSEMHCLQMLKQKRVDGVIFGAHSLDTAFYQSTDRPVVALDRDLGPDIPCVAVDHRAGGRLAAQVLLEAGCRNVLQFGVIPSLISPSNERHEEFDRVMRQHGVPCQWVHTEWFGDHFASNLALARETLARFPDIDGVFGTDIVAMCTLKAARERGLRVPEDLKIVAYDGTGILKLSDVELTVVTQPIEDLARECVRLMLQLLQGVPASQTRVELSARLHYGRST